MIDLEKDDLGTFLQENKKVLVQYGAGWCGNCRMIKPKIKNLAKETDGITFLYVDAEKLPGTRQFAQVNNLPTFASFVDGKLVNQAAGNKIEVVKELVDEIASH